MSFIKEHCGHCVKEDFAICYMTETSNFFLALTTLKLTIEKDQCQTTTVPNRN